MILVPLVFLLPLAPAPPPQESEAKAPDPVLLVGELSSKDPAVRSRAEEALLELGPAVVPAVLRGLYVEEVEGRRLAAKLLRAFADERSGRPLRQRLPAEPDPAVRAEIVYALGAVRPKDLDAVLVDRLQYENEPRVLRAALATLGDLGDPRLVGAILDFAEAHAEDRYLLSVSVRALGDLTNRRRLGVDLSAWRQWWTEHGPEVVRRYEESLRALPTSSAAGARAPSR